MQFWTLCHSIAALVAITLAMPTAHANAVTDWNAVTIQYVAGNPAALPTPIPTGRAGPPGLLDIALVQAAVHDAVQTIEHEYKPYYYSDPLLHGVGSPEAAVAAAAHRMLVLLYPGQQAALDTIYGNYLVAHGLVGNPGLAVGEAAAAALITQYRAPVPVEPFYGVAETGEWRSAVPMAFLPLAFTEPFTLKHAAQFRPQPPPPLTSRQYAREYNEVKSLGSFPALPTTNTELAYFWSVDFVAQWNEVMRAIADAHVQDIGDSARLFALANLAAADAAIAVWDCKYYYNFWRPNMAIIEGETDGNNKTAGDPYWTTLFSTIPPGVANPAYPDYVSGANGLTGAFTGVLRNFFGTDELDFWVKTTRSFVPAPNRTRYYTSFSQAAQEVVDARILLGIHFRAADEEARRLGNRVAHWTFQKYLRPVRKHGDDHDHDEDHDHH